MQGISLKRIVLDSFSDTNLISLLPNHVGDDSKMSDKMASAAALWNDMGEAEKTSYKHRAAAEKQVEIEDLDEEGKDVVARSLRKKIDELVRHFFCKCSFTCRLVDSDITI